MTYERLAVVDVDSETQEIQLVDEALLDCDKQELGAAVGVVAEVVKDLDRLVAAVE